MTPKCFSFICGIVLLFASVSNLQAQEDFDAVGTFQPLLTIWNDAINAGDVAQLGKMYADELYLYGGQSSKAACLESKKKFFLANPDYHQTVDDVHEVRSGAEGRYKVFFTKSFVQKGVKKEILAYLTFDALENENYSLIAESDEISDKNAAKNAKDVFLKNGNYCFEDAGTVFNSVAIPAPYSLTYQLKVLNGQVTGEGGYYSSAMRSYYTLSIAGISKSDGTLTLQIRAEGPLYPDVSSDLYIWQQQWKYNGQALRWIGGNVTSSPELDEIGCD